MRPSEIKVGCTYRNRGAGRTWRKVQCISTDVIPSWSSHLPPPVNVPCVRYVDNTGRVSTLYLCSFASWAGSEVKDGKEDTI